MALRVKLLARGRQLTPYVSSVVTDGRVQKAFAEQIGRPVGACVRGAVHAGMGAGAIKNAVRQCAKQAAGKRLSL